ncbi:MAG: SH3 domain-containing protein [Burkholderiales bacterium]|nr:SH3 domain-containing protein [Phycisphaerae bacterium]
MKSKTAMLIMLTSAVAVGAMVAETVVVKSAEVTLRDKPSTLAKKVTAAPRDTSLNVITRQGEYIRVSVNGQEGWIRSKDLEPLKVGKSGGSVLASAVAGDANAGEAQEAGAGKGLMNGAENYARSVGVDPKKIDALRDRRKRIIDSGEWEKFAAEGKVGAR